MPVQRSEETASTALPLVSVICPTRNGATHLRQCLDSVLSQSYPNIELIVIDCCSADSSIEILESYGSQLQFVSESDTGQSQAINKGMAMATGEVLAWLNSDDEYLPMAIENAVKGLERTGAGLLYGDAITVDRKGRRFGHRTNVQVGSSKTLVNDRCFIIQPAAFWRRDVWDSCGPLREDLHYALDYDLFMRMSQRTSIAYWPYSFAVERLHGSAKTFNGHRNRIDEIREAAISNGALDLPKSFQPEGAAVYGLDALTHLRQGQYHQARLAARQARVWAHPFPRFLAFFVVGGVAKGQGLPGLRLLSNLVISRWRTLGKPYHSHPDVPRYRFRPERPKEEPFGPTMEADTTAPINTTPIPLATAIPATAIRRLGSSGLEATSSRGRKASMALASSGRRAVALGRGRLIRTTTTMRSMLSPHRLVHKAGPRLGVLDQHPPKPLTLAVPTPPDHQGQLPSITIVTPSFNQARYLRATMDSVLDQNYPHLEYIVQDAQSTDGSVDVLRSYEHPDLRWFCGTDTGQANGINLGQAKGSGQIMAWLNSDDVIMPGTLDYVGAYFAEHPETDVVYGHRILIDSDGSEIGRWVLPAHDESALTWADYIPQETLFWRRSVWDKAGPLDETFRFALDWDLLLRFAACDAKTVRLPIFSGGFRVHPEQLTSRSIDTIGAADMARLRRRCHGRDVTSLEIAKGLAPFMARHIALDRAWRMGIVKI